MTHDSVTESRRGFFKVSVSEIITVVASGIIITALTTVYTAVQNNSLEIRGLIENVETLEIEVRAGMTDRYRGSNAKDDFERVRNEMGRQDTRMERMELQLDNHRHAIEGPKHE